MGRVEVNADLGGGADREVDIDVAAGLPTMREQQAFSLYATRRVLDVVDANSIFEVLARDVVTRREVRLDVPCEVLDG